ncbi:hypothetical protein RRF57_007933 [Xylaria bambusicola]|uniref:Ketoreductase (KR) domain-containing protein n=1 Tax=Xylaria bambusicola TaxID=326684 RepID=A0AAN7UW64_9PEZI
MPLETLSERDGGSPLDVLEWPIPMEDITGRVRPADSQVHFSGNKTYWLSGLSRSPGLLLCEWMVDRGAKFIVISSRSPKIKDRWIAQIHSYGADV